MKVFRLLLLLATLGAASARADIPPGWSTDYAGTVAAAAAAARPTLVYFTATWCGPCKMMTSTTLQDAPVSKVIAGISHVGVDIDAHQDLATQYGVNSIPTFVLIAPGGDEVERTTGYEATADFLPWLNGALTEAQAFIARKALGAKTLANVDQLLTTGTGSMDQAVPKLLDLCDERDDAILQQATDRLSTVAKANPALLLDGLNDPRLAPRIAVANLLRAKLGGQFEIDPWSDAPTRALAVRALRAQLAAPQGKPGG